MRTSGIFTTCSSTTCASSSQASPLRASNMILLVLSASGLCVALRDATFFGALLGSFPCVSMRTPTGVPFGAKNRGRAALNASCTIRISASVLASVYVRPPANRTRRLVGMQGTANAHARASPVTAHLPSRRTARATRGSR